MEFRDALKGIIQTQKMLLSSDTFDKDLLVTYASCCKSAKDYLQLQEYKNILSAGVNIGQELVDAYLKSRTASDKSFFEVAKAIENIADRLESANISCFSYSYFISSFIYLIAEINSDGDLSNSGIPRMDWINPEYYDYSYRSEICGEKTFGFGRLKASIKDFSIKDGILLKYKGKDPYVIIPNFVSEISSGAFEANNYVVAVYCPQAVTKLGTRAFCGCQKLETICLGDEIKRIPAYAFEGCKVLKRINLGKIEAIGEAAFKGCAMLENVDFASLKTIGAESLAYCIKLRDFSFITKLKRIGEKAFSFCSLFYVSLENEVQVGDHAFLNCMNLTRIHIDLSKVRFGESPFYGCESVTMCNFAGAKKGFRMYSLFSESLDDFNRKHPALSCVKCDDISNSEFKGCENLTDIEVRFATEVPNSAFADCKNLKEVAFRNTITAINDNAFKNCNALTDLFITLSDGIHIGERAFYRCYELTCDPLLDVADTIGSFAFAYTNLESYNFEKKYSFIGAFAFANAKFKNKLSLDLSGTKVLPGAFHGIHDISSLKLTSLYEIFRMDVSLLFDSSQELFCQNHVINYLIIEEPVDDCSFAGCANVRYIECSLSSGKIPDELFCGCEKLESAKINGSISSIGKHAFRNCNKLSYIDWTLSSVISVGDHAFDGCVEVANLIDISRIKQVGEYAFANTKLSTVNLENAVSIGIGVFNGCIDLVSLKLPFLGGSYEDGECDIHYLFHNETDNDIAVVNLKELTVRGEEIVPCGICGLPQLERVSFPEIKDCSCELIVNCPKLTEVSFGKNLSSFSMKSLPDGFAGKICISPDNAFLTIEHGSVISKDKTTLFYLANPDDYHRYLNSVNCIKAFAIPAAPERVTIPQNIYEVEPFAFNCERTVELAVESNVKIAPEAFYNCDRLENVYLSNVTVNNILSVSTLEKHFSNITLNNVHLDCKSCWLTPCAKVSVDSFKLANTKIESIDQVLNFKEIGTLSLETPDCVSVPVFENARVGNVSMVPQIIAVSEIFNNRGNAIVAIQLKQGPVRSNEFANLVARSVTITGASTIEKNAFDRAVVSQLYLNDVDNIEENAFHAGNFDQVSINCANYYVDDGFIIGKKKLLFCFTNHQGTITIPSTVEEVCSGAFENKSYTKMVASCSGTSFHDCSFVGCNELSTLDLNGSQCRAIHAITDAPQTITSIQYRGKVIPRKYFSHLSNLQDVTLYNAEVVGDLAFYDDKSLTTIEGLQSVYSIGSMAFSRCSKLSSLAISPVCNRIGIAAFEECTGLKSIEFPICESHQKMAFTWNTMVGRNDTVLPDIKVHAQNIPAHYFERCGSEIIVVDSPKEIGDHAFAYAKIKSIDFDGTEIIEDNAFEGTSLSKAVLPLCRTIGDKAFSKCSQLRSITLNSAIQSIGPHWILGSNVAHIDGAPFGNKYRTDQNMVIDLDAKAIHSTANDNEHQMITVPLDVEVLRPESFEGSNVIGIFAPHVKQIEESVFEHCSLLSSLQVPFLGETIDNPKPLSYWFKSNHCLQDITVSGGELVEHAFQGQDNLYSVSLPEKLTQIKKKSFSGCSNLERLSSLKTIEMFEEDVFDGCYRLSEISLPFVGRDASNGKRLTYLFPGDPSKYSLGKVTIDSGNIVNGCFSDFVNLNEVELPPETTDIPEDCFKNCESLTRVNLLDKADNKITTVHKQAFFGCRALNNLTLPAVKSVESKSFEQCIALKSIKIGKGATSICQGTFDGCTSVEYISFPFTKDIRVLSELGDFLPHTVQTIEVLSSHIGESCLAECEAVISIALPYFDGIIPAKAFLNCSSLENLSTDREITVVAASAFEGCSQLNRFEFANVIEIGEKAFCDCKQIGDVILPNVESIGKNAFSGCTSMGECVLGDKLTRIEEGLFENSGVTSVHLPSSLQEIQSFAFRSTKIRELDVPETLTSVGESIFMNGHAPVVYVFPKQVEQWDSHWADGCKHHGFLWLSSKAKTKVKKIKQVEVKGNG